MSFNDNYILSFYQEKVLGVKSMDQFLGIHVMENFHTKPINFSECAMPLTSLYN